MMLPPPTAEESDEFVNAAGAGKLPEVAEALSSKGVDVNHVHRFVSIHRSSFLRVSSLNAAIPVVS